MLGVAYKAGVNDVRESPALNVMKILADKGAVLSYTDPYVPIVQEEGLALESTDLDDGLLASADCVVILTAHREIDYQMVIRSAQLVVDTRNALHGCKEPHVMRL